LLVGVRVVEATEDLMALRPLAVLESCSGSCSGLLWFIDEPAIDKVAERRCSTAARCSSASACCGSS
jgi:hypothetical protein